jgi:hopanoid biosynthesis associated protein HpnK
VGENETKRLIVNADDLALHPAVNRAVFRAHREGIVSSTTILAGGAAFSDAIEQLKQHPDLGVGLHLCLVDQLPIMEPGKIPTLVGPDGRLESNYASFLKKYLLGKIRQEEIRLELEAQVEKAIDHGLSLTHLDSHQHLHVLPGIARLAEEIGKRFAIKRIRIPDEHYYQGGSTFISMREIQRWLVFSLAHSYRSRFGKLGWGMPDHFHGFIRGGRMLAKDWRLLIPRLQVGVSEVMVHPGDDSASLKTVVGSDYCWESELAALVDRAVSAMLQEYNIELINFGDLC